MRKFYVVFLTAFLLFYVQTLSAQQQYYVNDNSQAGDIYTTAIGSNSNNGSAGSPFSTIAYAVSIAAAGDIILVDAGVYVENLVLNKAIVLKGVQASVSPGALLSRGAESIIIPASNNNLQGVGIAVNANNIIIDGLTIDGDNPGISGGISINGKDANAGLGIFNQQVLVNGLVVKNNIIKNFSRYGVFLQRNGQPTVTEGIDIANNHIDNISSATNNGRGVAMFNNAYAEIRNNTFTRIVTGILFANGSLAPSTPTNITGNSLETYSTAIQFANMNVFLQTLNISGNTISTSNLINWNAPGATQSNFGSGISMTANVTGNAFFNNNNIANKLNGLELYNLTSPATQINGGSISNSVQVGLFLVGGTSTFSVSNFSLLNNAVAMDASNDASLPAMNMSFNNVTVTGGSTGLRFYGPDLHLSGNSLNNVQFSGQSSEYLLQTANSFNGQTIDISSCTFEGVTPANMTMAQLLTTEDKIMHRIDYNNVGFFKLKPNEVFVTANSFLATLHPSWGVATTFPDINRAVAAAAPGDIIHVGAGTYINQVNIDKGLSLIGAGSNLTHIRLPASGTAPPPNFAEQGVIQSLTGIDNVIIRSLSASAQDLNAHAILLQTGGEVALCSLSHSNQGVFFRYEGGLPRSALVDKNDISNVNIGVNCVGQSLTATATDNTITLSNPGFSAGFFIGLDFGAVPQFTATGNTISNYATYGFLINSFNTSITQNSIVGNGLAIQQFSGSPTVATCNWFGNREAEVVAPKIAGNINFTQWLVHGYDNNTSQPGFQPVPNTCTGRQTKFYVNDANLSGDVLTTAVGSNSNNGFSTSPFATIEYALTMAQPFDSIFVDAGSYNPGNLVIGKSIFILGSNHNISPNNNLNKTQNNTARNAEAVITGGGFVISSDWIIVNGLRFGSAFSGIQQNGDFSHIKLNRNYFTLSGTNTSVVLTGISTSPIVAFDYAITENRFERTDNAAGNAIFLGAVRSLWVDNNVFIESGPVTFRSTAVRTSTSLPVDGAFFANNYFKKLNLGFAPAFVQNLGIFTNQFDSCNQGFNMAPSGGISSNIFINSNTFTDMRTGRSILLRGGGSATLNGFSIANNMINQSVNGINGVVSMIHVEYAASVVSGTTTIANNKMLLSGDYTNTNVGSNCGILLAGNHSTTIVSGNELNFTAINSTSPFIATALPPVPAGIFINTDGAAVSGLIPATAVISISNNIVSGFKQSVAIYDPTGIGITPQVGYGYLTTGATVTINNNSFTGNLQAIDNGTTSQSVSATCNWYGLTSGQGVLGKIGGSNVVYNPWLVAGTDTDPATGFQPQSGSCTGTLVAVTLGNSTNISCYNANNGAIDINITGGAAPYVFEWTRDDETYSDVEDLGSLAPGTYSVTVTDTNGTTASLNDIIISEPLILTASADGTAVSCFAGNNGTASAVAEGGTAPYTYLWSNGATTEDVSNLVAGTYTVTITDANGCTAQVNFEVTQPQLLNATATGSSTACFNSITTSVTGGTAPYSYLWSNGVTTPGISSIASGSYSVTVTDTHGCTAVVSATVTANEAFNPSASVTHVSCFGTATGSITVTNVNAVAPFQFSIDGGVTFQPGNIFNNLVAGVYTITVKDANGCTGFVTKTVTQPPVLTATLSNIQKTCYGSNTGSITVNVSGGTAAYGYSWTGPGGYTSSQLNIGSLASGNYTLNVTDSRNCVATLSVTVGSLSQVIVTESVNNISCKGETNGSIQLNVTGGSGSGFTFSWNTGATTSGISGLSAGNYNVTITDAGSGCTITRNFTITQPASLVNFSVTKSNATGCLSLGTITATGSGGAGGYTYKLNNGTYQSNGTFTGLLAGSYTVWVKDVNGCTKSLVVSLTDNGSDEFEGNNSKTQAKPVTLGTAAYARLAIATDAADWFRFTTTTSGTYTVNLSHPSLNFNFNVYAAGSNTPPLAAISSTATTKQYSLAPNTTYYIGVTGGLSFNCYTLMVNAPGAAREMITETKSSATLKVSALSAMAYPNPHKGSINISVTAQQDGRTRVELFGINGQKIVERTLDMLKGETRIIPFTGLRGGTIVYRVQLGLQFVSGKVVGID